MASEDLPDEEEEEEVPPTPEPEPDSDEVPEDEWPAPREEIQIKVFEHEIEAIMMDVQGELMEKNKSALKIT